MQAIVQCPICNGNSFKHSLTCKDYTVSHETFSLMTCETCGLLITSPRPSDGELGKYYVSEDYISHSKKSKGILDKVYQISRLFTLGWKLKLIRENRHTQTSALTLLDFGCGTGEFIEHCKRHGLRVKGVEPSEVARNNAAASILKDIYPSMDNIEEQFDAITLWHVLEHIPDLNQKLFFLKEKLKKNGIMFIAVPNHQSRDGLKYKQEWAGYDVPRHLWHFTQQSMTRLLTNHNMTVEKIIPMKLDAFYVSMLSEKYKRKSMNLSGLVTGLITGIQSNFAARNTNQYSSLIYVIRK